ncbi:MULTISPECIES: Rz1-like lysis system protein LysC [Serratia]|uniref:Rz1-like lysis system protein LysC n=1 Tax=Serratia marcescens TaxID=615 RepID=UPI003D160A75
MQPPEPLLLLPPESVFTPCELPEMVGDTWGDALSYTLALQTSLKICAGRIATLNAWRSKVEVQPFKISSPRDKAEVSK